MHGRGGDDNAKEEEEEDVVLVSGELPGGDDNDTMATARTFTQYIRFEIGWNSIVWRKVHLIPKNNEQSRFFLPPRKNNVASKDGLEVVTSKHNY